MGRGRGRGRGGQCPSHKIPATTEAALILILLLIFVRLSICGS
jgi:hypothetical protein